MRVLDVNYQTSGAQGSAALGSFNVPALLIQGETYTLRIPVSWSFISRIWEGVYDWKKTDHFTFSVRLPGYEEQLLHFVSATAAGLSGVREGTYIFNVRLGPRIDDIMGIDLPLGSVMLYFRVEGFAYYESIWPWNPPMYGPAESSEVGVRVEVVSGAPICSFVPSTTRGQAPLYVEFTDTSQGPEQGPITAWAWDFGDDGTSYQRDPTHTFRTPGTYTVTLTVTNKYGSDSASVSITVLEAGVMPIFHQQSYCPSAVDVDEPFTPLLVITNQGGAGNIFVNYMVEGKVHSIIDSVSIGAYGTYNVPMTSHTIDWYLGYRPEETRYVDIIFQTGPVGKTATGQFPVRIYVSVGPGPGPGPGWLSQYWPFLIGGGLMVVGGGAYLLTRRK